MASPDIYFHNVCLTDREVGFDVQVPEGSLGDPTPAFAAQVLGALGVPGRVMNIHVDAFCTPYFAVHDTTWCDRVRRAWRVTLVIDDVLRVEGDLRPFRKAIGLTAADATVTWSPDHWNDLPGVVIGDFPLGNWPCVESALREPALGVVRLERLQVHEIAEQVRVHLGPMSLPADEPRLVAVEERLRPFAALRPLDRLPRSRIARPGA